MATIKVLVNNVAKYEGTSEKAKQARYAMNTLVCTLNPTQGVAEKSALLGNGVNPLANDADVIALGEAYKSALESAGNSADVISIEMDGKEAGSITRAQLAYKIYLALHPELWQAKITKVAKDATASATGDSFEFEVA